MLTGPLTPVSNRETWTGSYEVSDAETGDLIDLSTATEITIEVRAPTTGSPEFTLSLTGGDITIAALGVFEWRAEASAMRSLCAKTYEIGCTIEIGDDTVQLIVGRLPVIDGIVS